MPNAYCEKRFSALVVMLSFEYQLGKFFWHMIDNKIDKN